jgi:hypothetical protein
MSWNTYHEYLEEWERFDTHQHLSDKILDIVIQANWNKRILCNKDFNPNASDLQIHRNRFNNFIVNLDLLAEKQKQINYNYTPIRINIIRESLTKLKNYENKRISKKI